MKSYRKGTLDISSITHTGTTATVHFPTGVRHNHQVGDWIAIRGATDVTEILEREGKIPADMLQTLKDGRWELQTEHSDVSQFARVIRPFLMQIPTVA